MDVDQYYLINYYFKMCQKVVYFNLNRDLHIILIVCNLDVYATIEIYFI